MDFWECSTEGNILDNPFEYHGGEGLIDARIYFPPGNGNGRNVTTDPLLKACPEQSQVKKEDDSPCWQSMHNVVIGVLPRQVCKTKSVTNLSVNPCSREACSRFSCNQVSQTFSEQDFLKNIRLQPTLSKWLYWSASNPWSLHDVCRVLQGAH